MVLIDGDLQKPQWVGKLSSCVCMYCILCLPTMQRSLVNYVSKLSAVLLLKGAKPEVCEVALYTR